MSKFAQTVIRFSIIVFLLAKTLYSDANFTEAMRVYNANEFEKAYVRFKRMAEMGYFPAQQDLGVMYTMGQDVAKNPIQGNSRRSAQAGLIDGLAAERSRFQALSVHVKTYLDLCHKQGWDTLAAAYAENGNFKKARLVDPRLGG